MSVSHNVSLNEFFISLFTYFQNIVWPLMQFLIYGSAEVINNTLSYGVPYLYVCKER